MGYKLLDYFEYPNDAAAQATYVSSSPAYGSDILTEGTASADTEEVGQEAAKAVDDNELTSWQGTNIGYPHWWKYDLGVGVTKKVRKLRIYIQISLAGRLKGFTIQGSNNDSDWTSISTEEHADNADWQEWTFANDTSYRHYRILIPGPNWDSNNYTALNEIEMMEKLEDSLQSYSESTIKEQGSYSLKGVAAITDSLDDTLTRTVSPTIDLSNKDTIKLDVRASRTGSQFKIGFHDSGGTTTEHTVNIASADTWQTEEVDISAVSNVNKDVIDSIIITILNADAANIIYIDNMYCFDISNYDSITIVEYVDDTYVVSYIDLKVAEQRGVAII